MLTAAAADPCPELRNTAASPMPAMQPRPWGFWSTLLWIGAGFLVPGVASLGFTAVLGPLSASAPAALVTAMLLFGFQALILMQAVRWARWPLREYFALYAPRLPDVCLGVVCLVFILALKTGLGHVFEQGEADSNTMVNAYRVAQAAGSLPLLLLWAIVVAPVTEELLFRGFAYRGWSQTRFGELGAILLTSLLFAVVHTQYTWFGMVGCLLTGLVYGLLRWRTGSIAVPITTHALNNILAFILIAGRAG